MPFCFVCSKLVDGDADFFEHHINRCLDAPPAPALQVEDEQQHATDESVARALAGQQEEEASRDLIRALRSSADLASGGEGAGGGGGGDEGGGDGACPVCQESWEELGTGTRERDRQEHAAGCLEVLESGGEDAMEEAVQGRGGFGQGAGGASSLKGKGKSNGWDQVQGVQGQFA